MQDGVDQIILPSTGSGEVQPRGPWMKTSEFTGEIFAETAMSGLLRYLKATKIFSGSDG